ncbi:hypothetical protein TYRP_008388 [Tyrophagus putrescentiae]|nr:hypothetical protein TYRP_008388 [Tyrophagus putrescentiae]
METAEALLLGTASADTIALGTQKRGGGTKEEEEEEEVSPNEISLIDAENHVAHAETGALRGAALLNVRHKNAPTQLGMFALDDHDA